MVVHWTRWDSFDFNEPPETGALPSNIHINQRCEQPSGCSNTAALSSGRQPTRAAERKRPLAFVQSDLARRMFFSDLGQVSQWTQHAGNQSRRSFQKAAAVTEHHIWTATGNTVPVGRKPRPSQEKTPTRLGEHQDSKAPYWLFVQLWSSMVESSLRRTFVSYIEVSTVFTLHPLVRC